MDDHLDHQLPHKLLGELLQDLRSKYQHEEPFLHISLVGTAMARERYSPLSLYILSGMCGHFEALLISSNSALEMLLGSCSHLVRPGRDMQHQWVDICFTRLFEILYSLSSSPLKVLVLSCYSTLCTVPSSHVFPSVAYAALRQDQGVSAGLPADCVRGS